MEVVRNEEANVRVESDDEVVDQEELDRLAALKLQEELDRAEWAETQKREEERKRIEEEDARLARQLASEDQDEVQRRRHEAEMRDLEYAHKVADELESNGAIARNGQAEGEGEFDDEEYYTDEESDEDEYDEDADYRLARQLSQQLNGIEAGPIGTAEEDLEREEQELADLRLAMKLQRAESDSALVQKQMRQQERQKQQELGAPPVVHRVASHPVVAHKPPPNVRVNDEDHMLVAQLRSEADSKEKKKASVWQRFRHKMRKKIMQSNDEKLERRLDELAKKSKKSAVVRLRNQTEAERRRRIEEVARKRADANPYAAVPDAQRIPNVRPDATPGDDMMALPPTTDDMTEDELLARSLYEMELEELRKEKERRKAGGVMAKPKSPSKPKRKALNLPPIPKKKDPSEMRLSELGLEDFLQRSEEGQKLFQEFVVEEKSEENYEFWKMVQDYEALFGATPDSPDRLFNFARHIVSLHICVDAPLGVNLPGRVTRAVMDRVGEGDVDRSIFSEAKREIVRLMENDSFPRFKMTKAYQELCKREVFPPPNPEPIAVPSSPAQAASLNSRGIVFIDQPGSPVPIVEDEKAGSGQESFGEADADEAEYGVEPGGGADDLLSTDYRLGLKLQRAMEQGSNGEGEPES